MQSSVSYDCARGANFFLLKAVTAAGADVCWAPLTVHCLCAAAFFATQSKANDNRPRLLYPVIRCV